MQTITMYVSAAETLGVVRDSANARGASAPTFVFGFPVTLKIRLFAGLDSDTPYPVSEFDSITDWSFGMDDDFNSSTSCKIVADDTNITVYQYLPVVSDDEVPDADATNERVRLNIRAGWTSGTKISTAVAGEVYENVSDNGTRTWAKVADAVADDAGSAYTEFTVPIPDTNTTELEQWLRVDKTDPTKGHLETKTGLNAELVGSDSSGDLYVLQIKGFTVRSRILGSDVPPSPITPGETGDFVVKTADGIGWEDHNGDSSAHDGVLMPLPSGTPTNGDILIYGGTSASWQTVYGKENVNTAEIVSQPNKLYVVRISQATTLAIRVSDKTKDFDFWVVVVFGNQTNSFSFNNELDVILWPNANNPPEYNLSNQQPSTFSSNRSYMYRVHFDSIKGVMLAKLDYSVYYEEL